MTGTNTTAALQAAQMMQAMICMQAMVAMTAVAQQGQPYQATETSATKTRSALYAAGMTHVPGRSTKTAKPVVKTDAEKFGFRNGRFVG